ncbi:hypothetical protein PRIPAC_77355 [Pristionchus pacificus]|uniref:G protein-coupled receptor n=1 Tax=Pristionchus pacificus TaxID=54126 RepID=A0A2A6C3B2_PRIPA|nr:hypothetical protein PRIPAC_77355 [Pristionchus pacificus]|eukprot:PDM72665.1 G protein-coupled receptor [Pristionchus pacificus]
MRGFLSQSCYKIMMYLGIVDCGMIYCNSGMVDIATKSIEGSVYCQNPKMNFVYMICYFLYFSSSFTCFILGLNRFAELFSIHWLMASFKGKRAWLVLILPTIYGSYAAFCSPLPSFDTNLHVFMFDPMIGSNFEYANVFHSWNNLFFPTTTMLMYGFMAYKIRGA